MTYRISLLGLLALVGVLVGLAVPSVAAAPEVITDPADGPPGIYIFYDWQRIDPKKYPVIGGQLNWEWDVIETSMGKYNWGPIDKFISDMAAQGKRAGLRITSYNGDCCGGSSVPTFHKTATPNIVLTCSGTEIPRYWDTSYKNAWSKLVKAFGARYNGDPRVGWVEMSSGIFGETAPSEDKYDACLQDAKLYNADWTAFVNWTTDLYLQAFPTKQLLQQYAPRYLERGDRKVWTDYAAARGVGLKHNGLKPDGGSDAFFTDPSAPSYLAGQYDPFVLWGDKVPLAFEGTESSLGLYDRTTTMWSLYNALDKHMDWLVLDDKVSTKAEYQDLLQFAVKYLSRSVADTPSVWSALRETEFEWFPDYGNFEFYLYQNNSAPAGKTVPVWNVGTAAEGRYARSTDQASGNPNMFFNVDDGYVYGGNNRATITVTYYDRGTDRWELRYDGVAGDDLIARSVQKKNTLTWQKAVFDLVDVEFANSLPGGSDFRIWSANDGDNEIIHMVDVVATPGEPKVVALQPGVDNWDGLADTYLSAWSVDKNFGALDQTWAGYPDKMFSLSRWDLSPVIPQKSKIVTATLDLYQTGNSLNYANNLSLSAHRLLKKWDEAGATWNKATSSVAWQQPGALGAQDREATAAATANTNQLTGWARLDVTSLVQRWVDDPAANFGLLLKGLTDRNSQWYLASSEHAEVARRPRLEIHYYDAVKSTPTPSATPTRTTTPLVTATPTRTHTPSPTPSNTPTSGVTPTPSRTATPTPTATASATGTATATSTVTGRSLTSRLVASPPLIDGSLNEWAQSEMVILNVKTADTVMYQPTPDTTDINVEVRSFWDANWLYFGVHVTDNQLYRDSAELWHDDSIELSLDGANDQIPQQADDHQYTAGLDGRLADMGTLLAPEIMTQVKMGVRQLTGGYNIELAIPIALLQTGTLTPGKIMGFNVGANDDDDGAKRESAIDNWLVWEGQNTYNTPANYGKLELGDAYTFPGATFTPSPTTTASATLTQTPTATPTQTATLTPSSTATHTSTATPTPSRTPTASPTATPSVTPTPASRVWGRVWLDRNANGSPDAGEAGLAGVTLLLARDGGEVASEPVIEVTSQQSGLYEFRGVQVGNYSIAVQEGPYLRSTTPRKYQLAIASEGSVLEISFGVRQAQYALYLPLTLQGR